MIDSFVIGHHLEGSRVAEFKRIGGKDFIMMSTAMMDLFTDDENKSRFIDSLIVRMPDGMYRRVSDLMGEK